MPNVLANLSLALYPLFAWLLFSQRRPPVALGLCLLIAEMTLPGLYNLPVPSPKWLNKTTIPQLAAIVPAMVYGRAYFRRSAPFRGVEVFFLLGFIGSFFTMWTNRDALRYGPTVLQGEEMYDFVSGGVNMIVANWLPFYLGRIMFKTSRDLAALIRMFVIGAIIYTFPILIEVRFSPQIMTWIYGFTPMTDWQQAIRWGGYRPAVLMVHGLSLSLFMLLCTLMTAALARVKKRVGGVPLKALCLYLAFILVICKSTGSIVYAIALLPLVALVSPQRIARMATILAAFVLLYPLLRFGDILPMEKIASAFTSLSTDRAGSLLYRFNMEQGMLDLTRTRPWFGMGGYGRNFVFDPNTGRTDTVIDGAIIFCLSGRGLVGFFTFYGPLLYSVLAAARSGKRIKSRSNRLLISTLALCCSVILFDLIINSTFPPLYIMLFGSLNGLVPGLIAEEKRLEAEKAMADAQGFADEEIASFG